MQLSRRGWNNVVIYSMLFMLLLFGAVHRHITREPEHGELARVLPPSAVVLALEADAGRIERVGPTWRSVPDLGQSAQQLDGYARQWQSLSATVVETMPADATKTVRLQLWLAGQTQPMPVTLQQAEQEYFLHSAYGQWQLSSAAVPFLLPQAWLQTQ